MIEDILNQDVPMPTRLIEGVLRSSGVAHLASLHPSPIGDVVVVRRDTAVTALVPEEHADEVLASYEARTGVPAYAEDTPPSAWSDRIDEALESGDGSRVIVALLGASSFQEDVLAATRRIPVGETRPYGWVAHESQHPGAMRAVGTALARNPVPLIIPCHRVVRSDGSLGEYAFGAPVKAALLDAEHVEARVEERFVGSRRGTVVCYPTCHHAHRINEPVAFRSLKAAHEAGYRPCRDCRPV